MEDHHVDRPGVEAQQCVKLTGTNSSIGLIVLINLCPHSVSLIGTNNTPAKPPCMGEDLANTEQKPEFTPYVFR